MTTSIMGAFFADFIKRKKLPSALIILIISSLSFLYFSQTGNIDTFIAVKKKYYNNPDKEGEAFLEQTGKFCIERSGKTCVKFNPPYKIPPVVEVLNIKNHKREANIIKVTKFSVQFGVDEHKGALKKECYQWSAFGQPLDKYNP